MRSLVVLSVLVWTLLIAAFPLWQLIESGHVFYTNALDEGSYLQYDYAKLVSEVAGGARGIQWLVPKLHELGLSGGAINLLFDLVCFPLTCFFLCKRLGYWRGLCSICLATIFTTTNPLIAWLSEGVATTDLLAWITLPFSPDHALLRSPEPQFTYTLAAICPYWGVPLALALAYPFVGLPGVCAAVAYPLRKLRFSLVLGCLATLLIAWIGTALFLNPVLSGYGASTHVPLFSFSALLAILFYIPLRSALSPNERSLLTSLIVGLLTAQNQQIVTGFLIQPANFEQYFGVPLCAYLCVRLIEISLPNHQRATLCACLMMFTLYLFGIHKRNVDLLAATTRNHVRVEQAAQHPRELVEFNLYRATTLNLVAARQPPTLLSITAGYSLLADRFVQQYRAIKTSLLDIYDADLNMTLTTLDAVYRFDNRNAPLNTIGRRGDFGAGRDTSAVAPGTNISASDGQ